VVLIDGKAKRKLEVTSPFCNRVGQSCMRRPFDVSRRSPLIPVLLASMVGEPWSWHFGGCTTLMEAYGSLLG
jgi:hypothetical protein